MRPRPAPIAARRATSRLRAVARTSSRLATFAHAMSSTKATAALRMSSVGRAPLTKTVCIRSRPKPPPSPSAFGNFVVYSAADSFSRACPCSRDTPRLRRAGSLEEVTLIDRVRIELKRHRSSGRFPDLRQIERRTDDANYFVRITARRKIVLPMMSGSLPNRRVHSPWLKTATFGPPGSSWAENVRPLNSGAPKSLK